MLIFPDVLLQMVGFPLSCEQFLKSPSCLGYIGDDTTQFCFEKALPPIFRGFCC